MKDIIIIVIIILLVIGWAWLLFRSDPEEVLPEEKPLEEMLLSEDAEETEEEITPQEPAEEVTEDTADEEETEPEKETESKEEPKTFIQCLADEGVVIYGMRTCPACKQLADSFGGYDAISLIYVECNEEQERCRNEMKTRYVPEIQVMGELFEDGRTPKDLSWVTGCAI